MGPNVRDGAGGTPAFGLVARAIHRPNVRRFLRSAWPRWPSDANRYTKPGAIESLVKSDQTVVLSGAVCTL